MNRDFKGVWIPKEIWLNEELTMLEKGIFTEISSLDNEETHCTAGNEYLAEFCQCSEAKITKAVKKLIDLGYIEQVSFDGRHRILRVVKSTMQGSKKYEADSYKVRANNIDINTDNSSFSKEKEPKRAPIDGAISDETETTTYECFSEPKIKKENVVTARTNVRYAKTSDPFNLNISDETKPKKKSRSEFTIIQDYAKGNIQMEDLLNKWYRQALDKLPIKRMKFPQLEATLKKLDSLSDDAKIEWIKFAIDSNYATFVEPKKKKEFVHPDYNPNAHKKFDESKLARNADGTLMTF